MRRSLSAAIVLAACSIVVAPAQAQSSVDPPLVEFAFSPGGAIVFTQKHAKPRFGNYGLGGAIAVNLTRFVSVESQIGGSFGASQQLNFGVASAVEQKTPSLIDYSGNLAISARTGSSTFFGRNTRYGHRVYGSVLVDLTP